MGLHRSFSILSTRGLGVYRVTPARASSLQKAAQGGGAGGQVHLTAVGFFAPRALAHQPEDLFTADTE